MGSASYNDWRLVSLSPLPVWALVLLLVAAVAGVVMAQRGLRKEPRRSRRWLLLGLRTVAMLAAAFLLLEPGVRLLQTTRVKNRLAILVDRSASMGFPAGEGQGARADAVSRFFTDTLPDWRKLADRFSLEPALFDREVSPVDLARLAAPSDAKGPRTDLLGAIRSAAEGQGATAGRKLSGIVLVTDGADNVALEGGLTPQARAELKGLGVPVSSLVVGEGGLKDLAVERIAVDDFAFVRNPVTVQAEIHARGVGDQTVQVTLKREGKVVATQPLRIRPDQDKYNVEFAFSPDQTGQFVYTVSVPVLPGEAVTSNNTRSFVLKVIRDRMRVLLVVGRPSWDERFLRALLKQDPNVDLVSFFILRSTLDQPKAREDELSLIPFPVREIFHEQLKTFDVVIFQNFAHRDRAYANQVDQYLPEIRDYVLEGGAFAMIGGDNSFGDGHYNETELADILPVEMDQTPARPEPFSARLTQQGLRHPITQLAPNADLTQRLFAELPPVGGLNVTRAKPNAHVLLEQPGTQLPLLALGEFGRGRSLALMTDGLWSWTLPAAVGGSPPRAYDKLWTQALRWLVKDPDLTTLRIQADKPNVEPGEEVQASVTVRKPDYSPAPGTKVYAAAIQVDEGKVAAEKQLVAGPDGTLHVDFGALPAGPYKLVARAQLGQGPQSEASDAVAVRAAGPELGDAAPRPKLLQEIAELTGGKSMALPERMPDLPFVEPEVVEVGARKDVPVWDQPWALIVLVLALGAEWALRRRWGFL